VIDEPGSDHARTAWRAADQKVSSHLLYVEARAAVARAERSGRATRRQAALVRALVDDLWQDVTRIDPDEAVVEKAAELCDRYGLRAYDAVHLASCESLDDDGVVLVAADGDLLSAARSQRLATLRVPS
jgi:predicted nucleic acid-binding protein